MNFSKYCFKIFILFCFYICVNCSPISSELNANQHSVIKRMIGGKNATDDEAPFMVRIMLGGYLVCSGAIIADDKVLTAAHCANHTNNDIDKFEVLYGPILHKNYTSLGAKNRVDILKPHLHPKYLTSNHSFHYDIAVLQLSRPILPCPYARAIEIDFAGRKLWKCDRPVWSYGFGSVLNEKIKFPKRLQVAKTYTINNCPFNWIDDWKKIVLFFAMMWSKEEKYLVMTEKFDQTTVQGDSGGPLVFGHPRSERKVIGVLGGSYKDSAFPYLSYALDRNFETNYFVKVAMHKRFLKPFLTK